MNVFVDTNILLEVILARQQVSDCSQILQAGVNNEVKLFASPLSFANMAYILHRSKIERRQIYHIERTLENIITVLQMDGAQLRMALAQEVKDFEDMMQYQCALAGNCDCILTINTVDFKEFSTLPIYEPKELLNILNEL